MLWPFHWCETPCSDRFQRLQFPSSSDRWNLSTYIRLSQERLAVNSVDLCYSDYRCFVGKWASPVFSVSLEALVNTCVQIQNPNGQIITPSKWRKNKNGKEPYQGTFYPAHPEKYDGDADKIVFRSGMELRLFKHLDDNPNVLSWHSEETIIPYVSPLDNKVHRYFMDVKATVKQKDGQKTFLFEVKEASQTRPPKLPKSGKKTARFFREQKTYAVNSVKWDTARKLCEKRGWDFKILTNHDLRY